MTRTDPERLKGVQEFFAARAHTWDTKFGDDGPAYAAAVQDSGIRAGATVLDVGCGNGRALPALRGAVGPEGRLLALDATLEMLAVAGRRAQSQAAHRLQADAQDLPLADGAVDVVFAAGLVNHLADPAAGLAELARITTERLVMFHPTGRAAMAARRGRELRPDETLELAVLEPLLRASGWRLRRYDDAAHRFFALADRVA